MADHKLVRGKKIIDKLIELGIADNRTQRVIIDIQIDGIPRIHVQKIGDTRLLELVEMMPKVEIRRVDQDGVADTERESTQGGKQDDGSDSNPDREDQSN